MKVGLAKADITPLIGTLLGGQPHEKRATYVESDLYAGAMYIEDANGVTVFVSCDILLIPGELADRVKTLLSSRLSVKRDRIFVSATHTHSGPITAPIFGMQEESGYLDQLPHKIVTAVEEAQKNLVACTLRACSSTAEGLNFNRRFIMKNGRVQTHPMKRDPDLVKPEGPSDPEVGVLVARTADGRVLGGIINFACHATVLDRYDTGISADYPGYVCTSMERRYPGPTTWLFVNGACGNVCQVNVLNPNQKEVGADWARHMGEGIAETAAGAVDEGPCSEIESLDVVAEVIDVPFRRVPDTVVEDARKRLDDGPITAPSNLSNYGAEHADSPEGKASLEEVFSSTFWDRFEAREILALKRESEKTPIVTLPVAAIRGGSFAMVAVPGELFAEWGVMIKKGSPFQYTFIAELTNGYVGYLPTEKAFSREGGYETKYVTTTKLAENAGEIVTARLLNLLGSAPDQQCQAPTGKQR